MKRIFIGLLTCLLFALPLAAQPALPTVVWLEDQTAWVSFQGGTPVQLADEEVFDAAVSPDMTRLAYSVRDGLHIIATTTRDELHTLPITVVPPRESDTIYNVFERLHWINADQLLLAVGFASDEPMGGIPRNQELPYYTWQLSTSEAQPFELPVQPAQFHFSPDGRYLAVMQPGELNLFHSASLTIYNYPDFEPQGESLTYYPNYTFDDFTGKYTPLYPIPTWNKTGTSLAVSFSTNNVLYDNNGEAITFFLPDTACRLSIDGTSDCHRFVTGWSPLWSPDLIYFIHEPSIAGAGYSLTRWEAAKIYLDNLPTPTMGSMADLSWMDNDTVLYHQRSAKPGSLHIVKVSEDTSTPFLPELGDVLSIRGLDEQWLAIAHIPDEATATTVSLANIMTQEVILLGTYSGRIGFF